MNRPPPLQHNPGAQRFEMSCEGLVAFVSYRQVGDRLTLEHTYVPEALRGRGLAAALVGAVLEEARTQRWIIVPQCSYVAAFLKRHPQFADLLELSDS